MGVLVRGLTDRNTAIRKQTAVTIGHLIGSAKSTSCEKLFNTLDFRYMEFEGKIYNINDLQKIWAHLLNRKTLKRKL